MRRELAPVTGLLLLCLGLLIWAGQAQQFSQAAAAQLLDARHYMGAVLGAVGEGTP
jgi:hypothetical protein